MEDKLKELDIPFLYVTDYLEEPPLGKAEWPVALSEVVEKCAEGEKGFAQISVRYNALKQRVANNPSDAPSVMLNIPYGDSWFIQRCGPVDCRCRRRLHLQEEHRQYLDPHRHERSLPARLDRRHVAECRHGEHA